MNSREFTLAAICTSFLLVSDAAAQDGGLYAEPAPEDASFVRFVGFADTATPSFAGKVFSLTDVEDGAYVPVSSALLEDIPQGSWATVFRNSDGSELVIDEPARTRQGKVFLFLLNTTAQPVELRLADNSATVIRDVLAGQSDTRGVNPVSVSLGVFMSGSTEPLETFDVSLKRGQNLSFIATADGVTLLEHSFAPVAR